jgi:hypothetical protein
MAKTGLKVSDMDVVEINEAFAAQAIPCIRETGMDPAKVNPYGGAIAMGHPMGYRIFMTMKALDELERTREDTPDHDVHRRRHGYGRHFCKNINADSGRQKIIKRLRVIWSIRNFAILLLKQRTAGAFSL